jgi:hypothetical protein
MPLAFPRSDPFLRYRLWARSKFNGHRGLVAYVESRDSNGDVGIGTAFHVGEGVFVTARHVVEGRSAIKLGFDDDTVVQKLVERYRPGSTPPPNSVTILEGPHYHVDARVDVACFRTNFQSKFYFKLGDHTEDLMGQYDLVLHRTLAFGHPRIPHSDRPALVGSLGEINAVVQLYDRRYLHFIVSTVARGGFSGGPVLVAYDETNKYQGTAVLGLVTDALVQDAKDVESGYMAVLSVDPIYECLELHNLLPKGQPPKAPA